MNFIDRYRKDMEDQNQNEEEPILIHDGIFKDGGGSFTATVDKEQLKQFMSAVFGEDESIGNGKLTKDYAEEMAMLPLVFHDKLKGKFSKRQITDMVCSTLELLACLTSNNTPV